MSKFFKTILVSYLLAMLCILLGFVFVFISEALMKILVGVGFTVFVLTMVATIIFLIYAIITGEL